jgi:glycosyltransferase involved in cell wall biosynthesis
MKIKAFIIMFNRVTLPKNMAEFLSDNGCEVILIDNNSTYEPLLDWYAKCPYKVYRLQENLGHKSLYTSGILDEYKDQYYYLTDHDLDLSGVPSDFQELLMKGFENPGVIKSGLSLKIDDLPNNPYANIAREWESKYWERPRDANGFYHSEVDTTFALYDRGREYSGFPATDDFFRAVRSPHPYTARHVPWYNTPENITEEEIYYIKSTGTYWLGHFKEIYNVN